MVNYENGANTRETILNAAANLFYQKGFHETSLGMIASAAFSSRAAVSYHFKNKHLLMDEIFARTLEQYERKFSIQLPDCEQKSKAVINSYVYWYLICGDKKYRRMFFQWGSKIDNRWHTGYEQQYNPVSYTHLTLPTILLV